jgi:radical SAM superfamily enzyme YgiQ (UPF0313 family)
MCELEKALNVWSFFVMDENFLLYRKRALRLLDLMVEHDKSWALYVFSSANVLRSYTIEQLVGLGVSWVWVGLEGKDADFVKLRGTDTRELVRTLQAHGIRVLGSSIIGLEEHTPQNIDEVIDYAVSHDADFHQFMLYTPIPGTPLHEEFRARGTLLDAGECAAADVHGQLKFNFRHPHITDGQETELLLRAFRRDFEFNGPSISRLVRTTLQGWQRYKNHPDRRIRQRFAREARGLAVVHAGGLWAARRWFRRDPALSAKIARILKDAYREFGLTSRLAAPVVGRYLYLMIKHEDRRLRRGWTYEPPTLCETSWMAAVGAHA